MSSRAAGDPAPRRSSGWSGSASRTASGPARLLVRPGARACGTSSATSPPTPRPARSSPRSPAPATPTSRSARCTGWSRPSTAPTPPAAPAAALLARLRGSAPAAHPAARGARAPAPAWPTTSPPTRRLGGAGRRRRRRPAVAAHRRRPASSRCSPPSAPTRTTRRGACGWASGAPTPRRTRVAALRLAYRRAILSAGRPRPRRGARRPRTSPPSWPTSPPRCSPPGSPSPSPSSRPTRPPAGWPSSALGKCGGRELNYVSDVDVVFVAEPVDPSDPEAPALASATRVAAALMRICREAAWEVDAALRPEGKAGALVRTARQPPGLLPAVGAAPGSSRRCSRRGRSPATPTSGRGLRRRALAAGVDGRRAARTSSPTCRRCAAGSRTTSRRRRPSASSSSAAAACATSSSPSSCCSWCTAGPTPSLRVGGTLPALAALSAGGYVGRDDAADADRLLPLPAHRRAPAAAAAAAAHPPAARRRAAAALAGPRRWATARRPRRRRRRAAAPSWPLHTREVRRLHEKLFYRPLLEAVARVPGEQLRLGSEGGRRLAARARLRRPGRRRCGTWPRSPAGCPGSASIQRYLLPVLLQTFAACAEPRRRAARLPAGQRGARRHPVVPAAAARRGPGRRAAGPAARLQPVRRRRCSPGRRRRCACSPTTTELEPRAGGGAGRRLAAGGRRGAPTRRRACGCCAACAARSCCGSPAPTCSGRLDVVRVGRRRSPTIAVATLQAALDVALRAYAREAGIGVADVPMDLAVIGMGRLGGGEMGYGSDADVLFVHRAAAGRRRGHGRRGGQRGRRTRCAGCSASPRPTPPLEVDADLRPEGRQGPLVRSLSAFREYYERWSSVWEAQALLRAVPGRRRRGARARTSSR